ncbi:hypothetical protein ACA910_015429 [Epithemia clementina (nom. ined.)]
MKELGYSTISIVLETWDTAKFSAKNFEEEFGRLAVKRLFELQPRAKQVFGYDKSEEEGKAHADVHARAFAGVFDSVFQMLGPDQEFIEEMLAQIGKRHKKMGVNPSFFPYMGQALMYSLEKYLLRKLSDRETEAWEEVFDAISGEIVRQILL